jgi:SAM-dependent methyltransferase
VPATTAGASGTGAYGRYALVYDLVWRAAPYDRFVDLCLEAATAQGTDVRRVLVAACGTGNAAIELAGRGLRVTGFDLSPAMLARAAVKCRAAGHRVELVLGDLRAVPLRDGCADLVLALNSSLNYLLDPGEVETALRHLGRVAAPGGTVVVEPLSARFVYDGWEPGRHVDRDGLHLDASYALEGDLLVERLRWSLGGVEETETYRQRFYSDTQVEALLGAAGLRLAERRPMWPTIPTEPARGRTLWITRSSC